MTDRSSLGAFLRSRRERVSPGEVGLPEAGRRRTPGLRREELALLADISVDYLVRLEQGRESRPSGSVLAALSDALLLDRDERQHLSSLVVATTQSEMCPTAVTPPPLPDTIVTLLGRLDPTPAVVLEPSTDLVAWNAAYEALSRPTGLLDADPPNLLRYLFLDPRARPLYRDRPAVARELVAGLRAATTQCSSSSELDHLVGELSVHSDDFARLWAEHEVEVRRRGVERLTHPVVGDLDLLADVLVLSDPGDRRIVTYLPASERSNAALDALSTTTTRTGIHTTLLRVVAGTGR